KRSRKNVRRASTKGSQSQRRTVRTVAGILGHMLLSSRTLQWSMGFRRVFAARECVLCPYRELIAINLSPAANKWPPCFVPDPRFLAIASRYCLFLHAKFGRARASDDPTHGRLLHARHLL